MCWRMLMAQLLRSGWEYNIWNTQFFPLVSTLSLQHANRRSYTTSSTYRSSCSTHINFPLVRAASTLWFPKPFGFLPCRRREDYISGFEREPGVRSSSFHVQVFDQTNLAFPVWSRQSNWAISLSNIWMTLLWGKALNLLSNDLFNLSIVSRFLLYQTQDCRDMASMVVMPGFTVQTLASRRVTASMTLLNSSSKRNSWTTYSNQMTKKHIKDVLHISCKPSSHITFSLNVTIWSSCLRILRLLPTLLSEMGLWITNP